MKPNHRKLNTFLAAFTLSAFLVSVFSFTGTAQFVKQGKAKKLEQADQAMQAIVKSKIAPDLEQQADDLFYGRQSDQLQRVIIQLKSDSPLNELPGSALTEAEQKAVFNREVSSNKEKTGILISDLSRMNGTVKNSYNNLGLVSAELPLSRIRELMLDENIAYISPDVQTAATGHLQNTTGTFQIRNLVSGTVYDGKGVGVAVLDSGIDVSHQLTKTFSGHPGVLYSKDFTGQGTTSDSFGHGSHVVTMVAGDATSGPNSDGRYDGVAPGVNIINLRVLNSNGVGLASSVIAAIDWAITNKTTYNIRVLTMSLGTVAKDSYLNDPMCQAARRAFNAGIVVVASAGNKGKNSSGQKIYGGISSPGIEPSVITVGATNTYGTDIRSDDTIATYSSRGPTRGWTLVNGVKKFDNLTKPDLVAPGNRLIGAQSPNGSAPPTLVANYPTLAVSNSGAAKDRVMYLSGTSMAAPQVAGAAAILLQANSKLTPGLVKAILMYSAQPLQGFDTWEQGAGQLNVDGAVRLARLVKTTLPTTNGSALLSSALPASQTSTIAGQTVYWGKGVVTNYAFLFGNDLMNFYQGIYGNGVLISDGTPFANGTLAKSSTLTTSGVGFYRGVIDNNGVLITDGVLVADGVLIGDGVSFADGVLIGDGVLISDGVLVADSTPRADNTASVLGDATACMLPVP